MPKSEIEEFLPKLEDFTRRIAAIKALYEAGRVPAARRGQAQAMMKDLKERLKADYKAGSTVAARAQMSQVESDYHNAIHAAYAHISVKWNSNPSHWTSDLYEAEVDLDWCIDQFKNWASK